MEEIDMDFHDEDSSFDTELETLDVDFGNNSDDEEEESSEKKDLVFYRRLDDY